MAESKAKALQKELSYEYPHIAKVNPEHIEKAEEFAKGYKNFLNKSKTERLAIWDKVKLFTSVATGLPRP